MAALAALTPQSSDDVTRWAHTRLRRRLLTGQWAPDLADQLRKSLGLKRARAIGTVDISSNPFAGVCAALSVLYDVAPRILHSDTAAAERMTAILTDCGWAAMMQDVQRQTLGLREMVLRVAAAVGPDGTPSLVLRAVTPDTVTATPDRDAPSRPATLREARIFDIRGTAVSGWEEIDPAAEVYRMTDGQGNDITVDVLGATFSGDAYPWRDQDGRAILPAVLYHARVAASLWDYTAWAELVEGTLQVGVDRSAYHHSLRQAAWAQRYTVGVRIPSEDVQGRDVIAADPSTILRFERSDPEQAPIIGTFAPPFDPRTMQAAVSEDERRLVVSSGVPEADILRMSADPRSGVALVQDRGAREQASRRFAPAFELADRQLLSVVARVLNSAGLTPALPESGWSVSYQALPPTETEMEARERRVLGLLGSGLISRVEARSIVCGEPLEVAAQQLAKLKEATNV